MGLFRLLRCYYGFMGYTNKVQYSLSSEDPGEIFGTLDRM